MSIRYAILRFITEHGYAPTVTQIARLIGRPYNRTSEAISRLEKAGRVRRWKGKVWVVR